METERYFCMMEMSSDDDKTKKEDFFLNMKQFKKLISQLLRPLTDRFKDELEKNNKLLKEENESLRKQLSEMSGKLSEMSGKLSEMSGKLLSISDKVDALCEEENRKKARLNTKYKDAIDAFCALDEKIIANVPSFGRAGKLNVIQMLVQYLYNPTDDLLDNIKSEATDGDKAISILKDIANFNNTLKHDLIHYLSSIEKKWEDCVLFPDECTYNPSTMQYFNNEIEEGTPIYVVSLGYDFPKSNFGKRLPKVFPKDIENKN